MLPFNLRSQAVNTVKSLGDEDVFTLELLLVNIKLHAFNLN